MFEVKKVIYLSYPLNINTPAYGNECGMLELVPHKLIRRGDSSNSWMFRMHNHLGTHVDAPAHFFDSGPGIADFAADTWHFNHVQLVEIHAKPDQIIDIMDLAGDIQDNTDLLLLRSGWGTLRGQEEYWRFNPGIAPALGSWIREHRPLVRALGMDWLSVSSFAHRDLGRAAHRILLDPSAPGHPVLLIEDMDLAAIETRLLEVWVAPIIINGIDSAPCTVFGVTEMEE